MPKIADRVAEPELGPIARAYPAVTDSNGTTWYRPSFTGRTPPQMWGWTADPKQAHSDYAAN